MTLRKIKEFLNCQVLYEYSNLSFDIKSANASDLMSDVLTYTEPGSLLLTGLTNNQVIRTCEITGISAVIFVRNKKPTLKTIKLAQDCKLPILSTRLTMFEACGILFSNGIKGVPIKKTD